MPVRRNNPAIDYRPLGGGDFKRTHRRFIWYYQYEASVYHLP
jgi:hypothetical protein